jgi:penicillin V acylase-like amidase (Ntn superfamily)
MITDRAYSHRLDWGGCAGRGCTRVTYFGSDKTAVTGRSMDWMISLHTNLWAFPEGVERDGAVGQNSLTWTSKFGSVISAAYDAATADGMNEKGLVANLLYLANGRLSGTRHNEAGSIPRWMDSIRPQSEVFRKGLTGFGS